MKLLFIITMISLWIAGCKLSKEKSNEKTTIILANDFRITLPSDYEIINDSLVSVLGNIYCNDIALSYQYGGSTKKGLSNHRGKLLSAARHLQCRATDKSGFAIRE